MPTSQPQALCLQQGILQHKHEARSLIKHLGWEIGALIAIPLLAIGIPKAFPGLVALPDAITTMAILKMASISIHSFHTQIRSPNNKFSWISKGMFITAMLLLIFVTSHNCSDETTACRALKTPVTFEIISLLSFWYMAAFLWMNIKLTREHKKEGSAGMVAFLEAFIYAVNFPAMLALGCLNHPLILHERTSD
jgi:hypothetical protein